MKKNIKIFGLFTLIGVVLTSCGSDDDDDPWVPEQRTITYIYSYPLQGLKGNTVTNNLKELTLKEILETQNIESRNFISAELQNTGTYFEITGLKAMESKPSLRNIIFRIEGKPDINLGTCSPVPSGLNEFPSDEPQSTNNDLKLINSIFEDLKGSKKSAQMKMTFTSTENIIDEDVKINICIRATYRYRVYTK